MPANLTPEFKAAEAAFRQARAPRGGTITGSTLRARPVAHKAPIAKALRERVWPLLASGAIRPIIDRVFPLTEAAAAHALMESNRHVGKLLLQVAPAS